MKPKIPRVTVGALIVDNKGRIFLMQSHKWHHLWSIPGGHIEYGESAIDAVRREVKEETNLDVSVKELLCIQECIKSDEYHDKERHFIFLEFLCTSPNGEVKINEEGENHKWVKPAEMHMVPLTTFTKKLLKRYIEGEGTFFPMLHK